MFREKKRHIAGLDIGTTKICALIGEVDEKNELKIVGFGTNPSDGLKKGVVKDIESASRSIQNAMWKAEDMAGVRVRNLYVGIAGAHIASMNHKGVVPISSPERGVVAADIAAAHDRARKVSVPAEREIINYFPQEYIIDDDNGIKFPMGMSGHRLEVRIHIVTANSSAINNLRRSVEQSGYQIIELLLESIASGYSVLSENEKKLGVLLIDIGGGTNDFAVYTSKSVKMSSVIPFGGDSITNDIAYAFRLSDYDAENLKKLQGCAYYPLVKADEDFEITGVLEGSRRKYKRMELTDIIHARAEEIFALTKEEIDRSPYRDVYTAGVVLTGGSSLMKGMCELAEEIFSVPVKIGVPQGLKGMTSVISSPIYSTAVGLVLYGLDPEKEPLDKGGRFRRFIRWLRGFFEF